MASEIEVLLGLLLGVTSLLPFSISLREGDLTVTYSVLGLLVLISLLVGGSLLLVWLTILLRQRLPSVTEDFADLA